MAPGADSPPAEAPHFLSNPWESLENPSSGRLALPLLNGPTVVLAPRVAVLGLGIL